ncbi:MAG: GTP cyclohydrolase I [Bacteroidota bacterium]|jgi:GTP cyclohydrolase I
MEDKQNYKNLVLINKANGNFPRSESQKQQMIEEASKHYGNFLNALGFNYENDPQTIDTPKRVAKAWMKDLIIGSVSEEPPMTVFPNEENYNGLVIQTGIPVVSICAHHNLPFIGYASVAYVPKEKVVGLSKLNRVVDWFSRRPQMQESLTQQIHSFLSYKLECESVAVSIASKHMCCGLRGIKHPTSTMTTNKFSGVFMESGNLIREEFMHAIMKNGNEF